MLRRVAFLITAVTLAILLVPTYSFAGGGPKNVLLVINDNSTISKSVGAYYQQKRDIPARNVCHIRCATTEGTNKTDYDNNIAGPIRSFINANGIHDRIDYIVVTKGIPLYVSWKEKFLYSYYQSLTAMLTCLDDPAIVDAYYNPYGPRASVPAPVKSFSHKMSLGGKNFYTVTRLDARTEADIQRMIDDSVNARPNKGLFLMDGQKTTFVTVNNLLKTANHNLQASGFTTYYNDADFDAKITEFVGNQSGIMGYYSWGSNETGSFKPELYLSLRFAPGSIADSYVSTSGRSFTNAWTSGQSMVVDLIAQGASGVNGYVTEPNVYTASYPNILFDRYTKGYNMGESFMAATPYLCWKSATAGDPLMAPYATPPAVNIESPTSTRPAYGRTIVSANATDASGIEKVEFYVDDNLMSTVTASPYRFAWDTTSISDGKHLIEAIAYENTDVNTQGMAKVEVQVCNTGEEAGTIGDLDSMSLGNLVGLHSKPVIAGSDCFTDCIYICEPDRSSGIKVIGTLAAPTGSLVDVLGEVSELNGERVIKTDSVTIIGATDMPAPLGMSNLWVSNKGSKSGTEYSKLQPGLYNAGLLVKTWGYVSEVSQDGFVVTDGSLPVNEDGNRDGIKVSLRDLALSPQPPVEGTFVTVTGVSCFGMENGLLRPTIRPRYLGDIDSNVPLTMFTSPDKAVCAEWNLLSLPGIPVNPRPEDVFGSIPIDCAVYTWESANQGLLVYDSWSPDCFPMMRPGLGFWLNTPSAATIEFEGSEPNTDMWIGLPCSGWAIIGQPFNHATDINRCSIADGQSVISTEEAVDKEMLDGTLYYFDGATQGLSAVDVGFGDVNTLEPWHGYWIKWNKPNLALIIPSENP